MNNAVVGGTVALVLGFAAIGAYVYVEQEKLHVAPVVSAVAAPALTNTSTPTNATALFDLYGKPATGESLMVTPTNKATVWLAKTVPDGADQAHVVLVGRQEFDAKGELVNNSHAAGVPLDAITYKLSNGKWTPALKQNAFVEVGAWGELREAKHEVTRFGNSTALMIEAIGTGQGYTSVSRQILAMEPSGWVVLGVVNTGADNSGACEDDPKKINADSLRPCWKYTGTIQAGATSPGKAYPDLTVVRTGTMEDETQKVIAATSTTVKFIGPHYADTP